MRAQAFALATLATLTGFGEYAKAIEGACKAPVLRLVPSPSERPEDEDNG